MRPSIIRFVVLLSAVFCGFGCANWRRKKFQAMHPQCPARDVTDERVTKDGRPLWGHYKAAGCGQSEYFVYHCIANVGCKTLSVSLAIERASFETGCPSEQFSSTFIDEDTLALSGCDRRLVYKPSIQGWILNTDAGPSEAVLSTEPSEAPDSSRASAENGAAAR
jgi:hypothetical protein